MANKPSASEKQYYESLVAETAAEVVGQPTTGAESTDAIIDKILKRENAFHDQINRFSRDVLNKAKDLKEKAKEDRERKIILKYEGEIENEAGKLRPAGIQEDFKFRIRAGNIARRIWGHSIDADKLNDRMHELQKLEDDMEKNRVELAQLKAAREATSTVIGSEKLGLTVGVTKASVVKQIYAAKLKAKGWTSVFSTETNLWDSYKAAAALKDRHEDKYKDEGGKKIVELEKQAKQLKTKKEVLEAALKRVEEMRKDGREIFESTFGNELGVLVTERQSMGEDVFRQRIAKLREEAKEFGKDAGFVGMDYFLKESLEKNGIKLGMFDKKGAAAYETPANAVETGRERVRLGKWYEKVFLKKPSENDVSALIDKLRAKDEGFLKIFGSKDYDEKENPGQVINWTLRLLLTGKDPDGKEILPAGRRAALNAENIVKFLEAAREASKKTGSDDELKEMLKNFATEWEYGAGEFVYAMDEMASGKNNPELEEERLEKLAPVWEKLTGLKFEEKNTKDKKTADDIFTGIMVKYGHKMGPDIFLNRMEKMASEKKEFVRFFYTGKFEGTTYISDPALLFRDRASSDVFFKIFDAAEKLFDGNPTRAELLTICKKMANREGVFREFGGKSFAEIENMDKPLVQALADIRNPKKKDKDSSAKKVRIEIAPS